MPSEKKRGDNVASPRVSGWAIVMTKARTSFADDKRMKGMD